MKLYKFMAIVAALSLTVFAWGCELDSSDSDTTNGGSSDVVGGEDTGGGTTDPCAGMNTVSASDYDLAGDSNCNQALFWDSDCADVDPGEFTYRCGKSECDFTNGICESMQPCGPVQCYVVGDIAYNVTKPCPTDADCFAANDEPPLPCEADGHCDTWCPNDSTGASIDVDCVGNSESGAYCPGGVKVDQCN